MEKYLPWIPNPNDIEVELCSTSSHCGMDDQTTEGVGLMSLTRSLLNQQEVITAALKYIQLVLSRTSSWYLIVLGNGDTSSAPVWSFVSVRDGL
jgi:hypothetical protein